jgi:hypothetical protein
LSEVQPRVGYNGITFQEDIHAADSATGNEKTVQSVVIFQGSSQLP